MVAFLKKLPKPVVYTAAYAFSNVATSVATGFFTTDIMKLGKLAVFEPGFLGVVVCLTLHFGYGTFIYRRETKIATRLLERVAESAASKYAQFAAEASTVGEVEKIYNSARRTIGEDALLK